MNCQNLIKNSYEYYDSKSEIYHDVIKNSVRYELTNYETDLAKNVIRLFDKKNKLILEANYESIGFLFPNDNLWLWAWATPTDNKNKTYISKDILRYGLDIILNDPSKNNEEYNLNNFLKTLLTNSRLLIKKKEELLILTYISLYLSKKDYCITLDDNKDQILCIYLFNIKLFN